MFHGFVKVAAVSPKLRVADCTFNSEKIIDCLKSTANAGAKVVVFPELSVTGATSGDLFGQNTLIDAASRSIEKIVQATKSLDLIAFVGAPIAVGCRLYNSAVVISHGEILGVVPKTVVFDCDGNSQMRWFSSAPKENGFAVLNEKKVPFGTKLIFRCAEMSDLSIAAEISNDLFAPIATSTVHCLAGANVIVNLAATAETVGQDEYRRQIIGAHSARNICAYIYADAGTGESTTDMVFAGHDLIFESGRLLTESDPFDDCVAMTEIDVDFITSERRKKPTLCVDTPTYEEIAFHLEMVKTALTRFVSPMPFIPNTHDEQVKNAEKILNIQAHGLAKRFAHAHAGKCVVGISGGLDSTLALIVSARAMDLLGRPHKDVLALTMPGFGTTGRTKSNAEVICREMDVELREVSITNAVRGHFADIGHDENIHDVTYENAQARERTQILMDVANDCNGLVIGTGDLSELALGWATYNGDHMSMYAVNVDVPKTLIRSIVGVFADSAGDRLADALRDILNTPVSPELLPADNGNIAQKTEDIVGPYELHDFYIFNAIRYGFAPKKIFRLAQYAFKGAYDDATILKWEKNFYRRFFMQQFKRSCAADGPKVGSVDLSPRGEWIMPSDACATEWLNEVDEITIE